MAFLLYCVAYWLFYVKIHIKICGFFTILHKYSRKFVCGLLAISYTYIHTQFVSTAIFLGEPGLASCPLNSHSPFIPNLHILSGNA